MKFIHSRCTSWATPDSSMPWGEARQKEDGTASKNIISL